MSRLFKVLCLALACASLCIFASSCGSSNSQVRVVQTISDAPVAFDVNISGRTIATNVGFPSVSPGSGYTSVSSGSDSFELFTTGTTTSPLIQTTLNMGGSKQYTVIVTGFYAGSSGANAPTAVLLTDNNTTPTTNNAAFRVVDASPSAPTSLDIYLVPPGTNIVPISPNFAGLTFQQASPYITMAAATYQLIVTTSGSKIPLISEAYTVSAGQIRTLVLINVQNGGSLAPLPVELSDLN